MAKKKISIDVFPDDAEVTIKVDGDLYSRITEMLVETALAVDVKDLGEHLDQIVNKEPTNRYEFHMSTLLLLIGMIEKEVEDKKLSVKKEIEVDIDDEEPKSSETPG
jgi:hypothetical protein